MMIYVVICVGCLECGDPTIPVGSFIDPYRAENALKDHRTQHTGSGCGNNNGLSASHSFIMAMKLDQRLGS